MTRTGWHVEIAHGSATEFHARQLPQPLTPTVWWFDVDRPALVLGSAQPIAHVDVDACGAAGIEVARRRSGGGAVLLEPDDAVWVDVVIPVDDPRWTADVSTSAWWLGAVWQTALAGVGMDRTTVHHGPLIHRAWSDRVCFAGLGGGELTTIDGRKIVGISQRRTRDGARFQCAAYRHWRPDRHVPLFRDPAPAVADLDGLVGQVDASIDEIRSSFHAALTALG